MRLLFFLLFSIISISQAVATPFGDAIANYTNSTFIENVGPYSPDKTWQESGHIRAWIDIVGFNNMMRENGLDYVPGNPADHAIIQCDAVAEVPGILDSLEKSVSVYGYGNNTIASLHVKLKYHTIACDKQGCYVNGRFTEDKDFIDSEPSPLTYSHNQSINASVVFYNNTYSPKAIISPENAPQAYLIRVTYQNDSVEHIKKKGSINKTRKGVKFVELYPADLLENGNETLFSMMNDSVVINTANFSISELNVTAVYPYNSTEPMNYSFTRIDADPYSTFSPAFYFVAFLVVIPFWLIKKLSMRLNL